SVVYTGSTLFFIAAIWFFGFGIFLLVVSMYVCCCRSRPYGYSRFAYALSLILLMLFTISAMIGSAVLFTGQAKFHDSVKTTLDYVLGQADSTVGGLKNVSNYLSAAKKVGVDQVFLPQDVQNNIDKVNTMITSSANTLDSATKNNKDDIFRYLDAVLVVLGWILVAITFILCGVFLVLHNVMGDTCVAMGDWVNNPTAHTALDDIIPCVDPNTAQEVLSSSKEVTSQMVLLVNGIIANVSNRDNIPPGAGALYYNQSGPLVPLLCNPYNSDRSNRGICATGEVGLNNATQLGLDQYGPFLTNLVDCSFLREAFSTIHKDNCPNLRLYSRWVYIGLAMVSSAVMLSLILWVLYARERRHRKYTKL
ncbi:hypothetical protein MIMGU_mgv1a0245131mg, partial [Erythranthe guttata]